MKFSSDNAEMSAIPLNVSRFYRFHYTKQQKISIRLIFSFKRMKFTVRLIRFVIMRRKTVSWSVFRQGDEFTCVDHFPAVGDVMMAAIFLSICLRFVENLNMLKTLLSVGRPVYAGRLRYPADHH
jgi:hypothetical protein